MRADNGHPAIDVNGDGVINNQDLFQDVIHDGILGGVNVGTKRDDDSPEPPCIAGMTLVKCPKVGDKVCQTGASTSSTVSRAWRTDL